MKWRDLAPYQAGRSSEGNALFSIPLKPDADGMIGRECKEVGCELRYFKISTKIIPESLEKDFTQISLYCPYCGKESHTQHLHTREQMDYVVSLAQRDAIRSVGSMLSEMARDFNRNTTRGGLFSITMDVKPGKLPMIRKYIEEDLRRNVVCDECGGKYAVFGIAKYCPWCGKESIDVHFQIDYNARLNLLGKADLILDEDKEVGYLFLGDCLENSVSLFEGYLKQIFLDRIKKRDGPEEAESIKRKIGNTFQNLTRASTAFRDEFGDDVFSVVEDDELEFLQMQFSKRHVLTHNLGLIDDKYLEQVKSWDRPGQEVPLVKEEINRTYELIKRIITNLLLKSPQL